MTDTWITIILLFIVASLIAWAIIRSGERNTKKTLEGMIKSVEEVREILNMPADASPTVKFNLLAHLRRQRTFSEATFGPGLRTNGVVDHIRKELKEIEAQPGDLEEWVDVILLAFDGAWRTGATPEQICNGILAKYAKNEARIWPDWRDAVPNKAIEHDRSKDVPRGFTEGAAYVEKRFIGDPSTGLMVDARTGKFYDPPILKDHDPLKAFAFAIHGDTLRNWRQLVEQNPADLATRIDAVLDGRYTCYTGYSLAGKKDH